MRVANDGYGVTAPKLWFSSESLKRLVKKYTLPDATREDIEMAKKHVKRCPSSFIIKEL